MDLYKSTAHELHDKLVNKEISSVELTKAPVSYTHLDVYKRQVLYRTNTQSRIFEEMLIKSGITYNMVGGLKFYDRKEIKDIICLLYTSRCV